MELLKGTLPFDIAVNTRYQSVQGVTSNMRIPIWISMESVKNIRPRTTAKMGVQIKFIMRAEEVNLMFKRDSFNLLMSTDRKTKKSIAIRNGCIKTDDQAPKPVWIPSATPMRADTMIMIG